MYVCRSCLQRLPNFFSEENTCGLLSSRLLKQGPQLVAAKQKYTSSSITNQACISSWSHNKLRAVSRLKIAQKLAHQQRAIVQMQNSGIDTPSKLAEKVLALIRVDNDEDALAIVQKLGSKVHGAVAWNHIIDYYISRGKVAEALRVFNDMKKRAQKPNSHTFTILFRGFAKYAHLRQALPRALKLYESMFAANSPVRPSTIHTNAIINVCARAKDMDALFEITSKIPDKGPRSPDALTYTVILNSLRHCLPIVEEEKVEAEKYRQASLRGHTIWREVIQKWKHGTIMIDEELVCAMARLLLSLNSASDCDNVLSLIEQTMLMKRELPLIGDPSRLKHVSIVAEDRNSPKSRLDNGETQTDTTETAYISTNAEDFSSLGADFVDIKYAIPGRSTLSILMEACLQMNAIGAAHKYWGKITNELEPDLENYHSYLRLLRKSRSSAMVLNLLKDMAKGKENGGLGLALEPKTFRIALSSSVRDWQNPHSLDNATAMVELMTQKVTDMDFRALDIYNKLLSNRHVQWSYEQMITATTVLNRVLRLMRSKVFYDDWDLSRKVDRGFQETFTSRNSLQTDNTKENVATRSQKGKGRSAHRAKEGEMLSVSTMLKQQLKRLTGNYGERLSQDRKAYWILAMYHRNEAQRDRTYKRRDYNVARSEDRRDIIRRIRNSALPEIDIQPVDGIEFADTA